MKKPSASLALAAVIAPVWAATQPVTLSVSGIICSARLITIKKTISKVGGVSKVTMTFKTREAVVTFDDAETSVQKLTKTTGDVGYPSSIKQWATEPDPGAIVGLITRTADKVDALGSVVSATGCAACLPAIASLGAAIGLGFLQEYEGLFVLTLLSLLAVVALLANAPGWLSHRQWHRSLLDMIGPVIVFAETVWLLGDWWTARLVYTGLALMIGVSTWDLVSSANRHCRSGGCELPAKHG